MNVKELKSRLINRSKDSLVQYSLIANNSNLILDLYEIEKFFLINNIIKELVVNGELTLKLNSTIDKTLLNYEKKSQN